MALGFRRSELTAAIGSKRIGCELALCPVRSVQRNCFALPCLIESVFLISDPRCYFYFIARTTTTTIRRGGWLEVRTYQRPKSNANCPSNWFVNSTDTEHRPSGTLAKRLSLKAVGDNCQSFPILPVARHWVHWAPGLSTVAVWWWEYLITWHTYICWCTHEYVFMLIWT